ncbi:helix-turn-helix domain-containing protein [uncultured Anaerococcus sp.]|uniref:helix-turn-helix domain-containing protein n=1 Tax=uncultured Anaerococcus sp. TaxID=293428 RepID=UPI0025CBA78C|nr:helix-turn-helix transcriptional regulator [uncultured Anaerococcus sp.]
MKLGHIIRNAREEKNLTIENFSKKLGKSVPTVYRYENSNGDNIPLDILIKICDILNVTPNELLGYNSSSTNLDVDIVAMKIPLIEDINQINNLNNVENNYYLTLYKENQFSIIGNLVAIKLNNIYNNTIYKQGTNQFIIFSLNKNLKHDKFYLVVENQKVLIARYIELTNSPAIFIDEKNRILNQTKVIGEVIAEHIKY